MTITPQGRNPLLKPNKSWHSRGYLPHFDCDNEIQSLRIAIEYIEQNPVKGGLVTDATQWRYSSVHHRP